MNRLIVLLILFSVNLFYLSSYSQGFRDLDSEKVSESETGIDVKLFRSINNNRNGFSNTLIPITDKSVLPVSIVLPLGLAGVSRYNKNYYDENSAVLMMLSEATGLGLTAGLKQLVKRERPFVSLKDVYYRKDNSPTDRYSFPSGHTTIAFSMATSLTRRYPDKPMVIAVSYLYAAIIGYGRIYLGVHYPSDVFAGMLIGSGSAALVYAFRKEIIDFKNNLFNEENRPDNNNNSMSAGAILGVTIGADVINMIINSMVSKNVTITSSGNALNAAIHF
jgi:membrane-associated phospholipid phosphatase